MEVADRDSGRREANSESVRRERERGRCGFSWKMMGSNIAFRFESEVPQLAGRIRRLPSPSIFFIIVHGGCVYAYMCARVRVCVCVWLDGHRKRILEEGNVSGRGRSVPADRSIGRDFKADCPYKVKNFPRALRIQCVYTYLYYTHISIYIYTYIVRARVCVALHAILASITRKAAKVSPSFIFRAGAALIRPLCRQPTLSNLANRQNWLGKVPLDGICCVTRRQLPCAIP